MRISLLAALAVALWAPRVHAERLLFVSTPSPIVEASRDVLVSWGVEIVAIDDASIPPSLPAANADARQLAGRHSAQAVVWLTRAPEGDLLAIYDARDGLLATREVDKADEIDEASAAALALSIKTLLLHSQVAPPGERVVKPAPERPVRLEVFSLAGVRVRRLIGTRGDPRLGIGARYWIVPRVGIEAQVVSGTGSDVESAEIDGRLADTQIGLAGVVTLLDASAWRLSAHLGGVMHRVTLDASVATREEPAGIRRWNPAADGRLVALLRLTDRLLVGAYAGGEVALRTQTYLVQAEPVLDVPRIDLQLGLYASVGAW